MVFAEAGGRSSRDEGQRLSVLFLAALLNILEYPADGQLPQGRCESSPSEAFFQQLPAGQRLDVLQMVLVPSGGQGQCVDAQYIHTAEGGEVQLVQNFPPIWVKRW